jgi:hypothetical protein
MRGAMLILWTLLCVTTIAQARALDGRSSVARVLLTEPCETIQASLKGAPVDCVLHAIKGVMTRMERRQQRWREQHPAVGREWD